jgi:hypothetical protein
MAVPASWFRPNGPAREVAVPRPTIQDEQVALPWADEGIVAPPPAPVPRSAAVEFEARVSPGGTLIVVAGRRADPDHLGRPAQHPPDHGRARAADRRVPAAAP